MQNCWSFELKATWHVKLGQMKSWYPEGKHVIRLEGDKYTSEGLLE
jgi:hypothetical protein